MSLPAGERYVIDITRSLTHLARGIDGIARVELGVAPELLALGGRAIWVGRRGEIQEVSADRLSALRASARHWPARARWAGRAGSFPREFALNQKQAALLRAARQSPFRPRGGERYLLFGAYWDRANRDIPALISRQFGAHIIGFIHDLVPVRHPELTVDAEEMRHSFAQYLDAIVSVGEKILVNSEFTARELAAYCDARGLRSPPIAVVPLGSDLDSRVRPDESTRIRSAGLAAGSFALMVSTLEPRKNHRFALELWHELAGRAPPAVPLVLAGKRGWLPPEMTREIERASANPNLPFVLIEAPSDGELAWLYQNAKFTLYPSKMEGWGLPVSESLSFGTHCLAADNSALKEASQGLAWHGPLDDKEPWMREIENCLNDPAYLARRAAVISERFRKRTWTDVARDLIRE